MSSISTSPPLNESTEWIAARRDRGGSRWWIPLLLVLCIVAALWPVCVNDFTTWDDYPNVAKNPYFNPVTVEGVLRFWQRPAMDLYIPVTYTVWGVLAAVAGRDTPDAAGVRLNPAVFHAANLLVHILAVLAAYWLLALLTRRRWAAALGAMLFALHPVQVEPVAWVAGMKDVLCGALSLLALWQYVRFATADRDESTGLKTNRWRAYAIATACLVLAMLAKPSAVVVPAVAALIDWGLLRRSWKRVLFSLWPWFVLAVGCAVIARFVQPARLAGDGGPIWARPLLAADALTFYLYKLVWPGRLGVQYHFSPRVILAGRWVWFAWIVPAACAVALWLGRRRYPWLAVAVGITVVSLLPVLGFVQFDFETHSLVADHYMYFAMLGPAMALSFFLAQLNHGRGLAIAATALVLVALGVRSYFQTHNWRDTNTLFEHELTVNPASDVAYNSLAERALANRQPDRAAALARHSIDCKPDQVQAYVNLASALSQTGRLNEAVATARQAADRYPDDPYAVSNLATLLDLQSDSDPAKLDEAIRLCRRAIELDAMAAQPRRKLADMLLRKGDPQAALEQAETAVRIDARDARNQTVLAYAFAALGQIDEARGHADDALALDPNYAPARRLLGRLHGRQP